MRIHDRLASRKMTARRLALLLFVLGACHSYGGSGDEAVDASSSPPSAAHLRCLNDTCPDDRPVCCSTANGSPTRDFQCRADGACTDGIVMACRDSTDCSSGTVCCMFRYSNRTMKSVACSQPELCVYPHVVLCDGQKPSCDAGEICSEGVNSYNRPLLFCAPP